MYLVFTRMPGENYRRRLGTLLLYLCYVFPGLINSLCVDYARALINVGVNSAPQKMYETF